MKKSVERTFCDYPECEREVHGKDCTYCERDICATHIAMIHANGKIVHICMIEMEDVISNFPDWLEKYGFESSSNLFASL